MRRLFLIKAFIFMAFIMQSCSKDINNPLPIKYALRDGLPIKVFEVQIEGLPKECNVKIESLNMMHYKTATSYAKLDKDGFVVDEICGKKFLIYFDSGYGEYMTVTICQSWAPFNKKIGILSFIPHPLEVSDEHGHWLRMIVRNTEGTEFHSFLSGFEPNEDVEVKLKSGRHIVQKSISVDEKGEYQFLYKPVVDGNLEGPFIVTVRNKTTEISLQHYWGKIALTPPSKYLQLKDKFPDFFNDHEKHSQDGTQMPLSD